MLHLAPIADCFSYFRCTKRALAGICQLTQIQSITIMTAYRSGFSINPINLLNFSRLHFFVILILSTAFTIESWALSPLAPAHGYRDQSGGGDRHLTEPDSVKAAAARFLRDQFTMSKSASGFDAGESTLTLAYISPDSAQNRLFIYNNTPNGYVWAMMIDSVPVFPAYSLTGRFNPDTPDNPALNFIRAYEGSDIIRVNKYSSGGTKGSVAPLLELEAIRWNQIGVYNDACPWDADANKHTPCRMRGSGNGPDNAIS
jgi:hypothetical protein